VACQQKVRLRRELNSHEATAVEKAASRQFAMGRGSRPAICSTGTPQRSPATSALYTPTQDQNTPNAACSTTALRRHFTCSATHHTSGANFRGQGFTQSFMFRGPQCNARGAMQVLGGCRRRGVPRLLLLQRRVASKIAGTKTQPARQHCARMPNPSLNRSTNGRPPGPGRWYAVHFHRPGPGVLPSSPA
jgi:hypothetical protein